MPIIINMLAFAQAMLLFERTASGFDVFERKRGTDRFLRWRFLEVVDVGSHRDTLDLIEIRDVTMTAGGWVLGRIHAAGAGFEVTLFETGEAGPVGGAAGKTLARQVSVYLDGVTDGLALTEGALRSVNDVRMLQFLELYRDSDPSERIGRLEREWIFADRQKRLRQSFRSEGLTVDHFRLGSLPLDRVRYPRAAWFPDGAAFDAGPLAQRRVAPEGVRGMIAFGEDGSQARLELGGRWAIPATFAAGVDTGDTVTAWLAAAGTGPDDPETLADGAVMRLESIFSVLPNPPSAELRSGDLQLASGADVTIMRAADGALILTFSDFNPLKAGLSDAATVCLRPAGPVIIDDTLYDVAGDYALAEGSVGVSSLTVAADAVQSTVAAGVPLSSGPSATVTADVYVRGGLPRVTLIADAAATVRRNAAGHLVFGFVSADPAAAGIAAGDRLTIVPGAAVDIGGDTYEIAGEFDTAGGSVDDSLIIVPSAALKGVAATIPVDSAESAGVAVSVLRAHPDLRQATPGQLGVAQAVESMINTGP